MNLSKKARLLLSGIFALLLLAAMLAIAVVLRTTGVFVGEKPDYATSVLQTESIPAILLYHSISDEPHQVTAKNFEAQIRYLADSGCTFLFPEEISRCDEYVKPVVITFDDGFRDNYETAFPVLQRYNAKATIFMITSKIGKDGYLTKSQIKELEDGGLVRVDVHTHYHSNLTEIDTEELRWQIETCNDILKGITNREPRVIAYPYGGFNNDVKGVAAEYYDIAFAVNNGYKRDIMAMYRANAYNSMTRFKIALASPAQIITIIALSALVIAGSVFALAYICIKRGVRKS